MVLHYTVIDAQGHGHWVDALGLKTDGNWLQFTDEQGRITHLFLAPISVCGRERPAEIKLAA